MKLNRHFLKSIIIVIAFSCRSQTNEEKLNSGSSKIVKSLVNDTSSLTKFLGTWVSHSKRHFQIVEIKNDSNATVYRFEHWRPIYDMIKKERYAYYKTDGKISITYQYNLLIETSKFKYPYFLQGDTLFEMAEPGRVDTLLKVYNDSTIER